MKSVKPSAQVKYFLIVDNHISHRSLDVLESSNNDVVILSREPWINGKNIIFHVTFYEIEDLFGTVYSQPAASEMQQYGLKKIDIPDRAANVTRPK